MTDIGTVPVLIREDGLLHVIGRRRVTRRHIGRAYRRGLTLTVGCAHITAVPDTSRGRTSMRCAVIHITGADGETIADFRSAA